MTTNFTTNVTDGIEIYNVNKKSRKIKALAIVCIAALAIIFGWTAFSGMKQDETNYAVQEHDMIQRDLKLVVKPPLPNPPLPNPPLAKATKAPTEAKATKA
eukprot:CAMPEP_0201696252 /NCGR_PEP_ID=MMETSP0578-20130828/7974_1 /ASSEMBLY_ACC=CAM_ASM_000663 /TAXON_ID=267565 /ORGANISM="Skeletonema grethea, Strain CCMP 1804" /LENGTH=100 /DNA_ID=CAMNT_0048182215 /DNA_START=58 /DNA_END=357 /DNA_ORIENTATION=+